LPKIPEAARQRLASILSAGGLPSSEKAIRSLWLIAGQIAAMDYQRQPLRRGRPRDIPGDALIERLYDFWVSATGKPPGVSRPTSGQDLVSGPFVRLVQQIASEILSDLEKQAPLGRRDRSTEKSTPLRVSLQQFSERPEKVSERLKAVRRFWKLPSTDTEQYSPLDKSEKNKSHFERTLIAQQTAA
jgi:hypothetical protein